MQHIYQCLDIVYIGRLQKVSYTNNMFCFYNVDEALFNIFKEIVGYL